MNEELWESLLQHVARARLTPRGLTLRLSDIDWEQWSRYWPRRSSVPERREMMRLWSEYVLSPAPKNVEPHIRIIMQGCNVSAEEAIEFYESNKDIMNREN